MNFKRASLERFIRDVALVRSDAIGCDECWEHMDRFAELALAGQNPSAALPLLQDHLQLCSDCREEYEALLLALKNLQA